MPNALFFTLSVTPGNHKAGVVVLFGAYQVCVPYWLRRQWLSLSIA